MNNRPTPDQRDTRRGAVVLARLGMITTSLTLVAFGPRGLAGAQAGIAANHNEVVARTRRH